MSELPHRPAHEPLDLALLRALHGWRLAGRHALLATVVCTWGSSPRPTGSMLALREDGLAMGSVSGGCIEDDIASRFTGAQGRMPQGPPQRLRYGVNAEQAQRFGLPCGGSMELLVEADPDAAALAALLAELDAGRLVRRVVRLADGAASQQPAPAHAPLAIDEVRMSLVLGPAWRLLLVGANAIAELLALMARRTGFAVTVCDPREDARRSWQGGAEATLVADMPDDAVQAFAPDRCSAVVGLTHDPKLDDLALIEALQGPAFYVGALGSQRSSATRRARLAEHFGIGAEQLARLRGPVGLDIGSRTPAEIAVSVMAQLLAVRNGTPA